MCEDSKKAIELDAKYFKAHLRLGEALIEQGKKESCLKIEMIEEGLQCLQQAYNLCSALPQFDPKYPYKQTFLKEIKS